MFFLNRWFIIEQLWAAVFAAPAVLFAVVCHEYAHGWVSERLGDPTPRASGRLSLNPFRHLDLWGTICLLFFHIGWAKPVPINPLYYKKRRKGIILVALAGPAANMAAAFICVLAQGLLLQFGSAESGLVTVLILLAEYGARINISLALFNLIPIPPLDGSKILGEISFAVKDFYIRWESYWRWLLLILVITSVLSWPLSAMSRTIYDLLWRAVVSLFSTGAGGGGTLI